MLNSLLAVDLGQLDALWIVINILVTLAVAIMMFVFFARRNCYRLAIIICVYAIVYLALYILSILTPEGKLDIAVEVARYFSIFWIVAIVEV